LIGARELKEKTSIVTDEISQDLDEVTRFLDLYKIRAVEIRTLGGNRVPDIEKSEWTRLKKRVHNEGWEVVAVSPGIFKGDHEDKILSDRELTETLPKTIYLAHDIDPNYIISFGFMCQPGESINADVVERLKLASILCANDGFPLLLENEPGSFAQTGENTRAVIDAVGHPNLYANWDPCNANILGDSETLAKCARALRDKILNVHVKDGIPRDDSEFPTYTTISSGKLGWKQHLKVLKEIGYKGYLGIETHMEPLWESSEIILRELREIVSELDFWSGRL